MDLQILSEAIHKLESMHNCIYDIKEKVMTGKFMDESLNDEYLLGVHNLSKQLRAIIKTPEEIAAEDREFKMQQLASSIYSISGKSELELKEYDGRKREFVQPKQVHVALLHKVFGVSLELAGSIYGRDHCTALHSAKTVANLYQTDKNYALMYEKAFDHCRLYDYKKTNDYLKGK